MEQVDKKECIACGFEDSQETIKDTPDGAIHQECMDDQEADLRVEYNAQRELEKEGQNQNQGPLGI